MEFVQRKTADHAVEHFLKMASEKDIPLVWDRYEGSLPQCGFCETGLSCRDCLQGPCISHPFRDQSKVGICGKDKDILGAHSFLRGVVQGSMGYLDQLSDFAKDVETAGGEAGLGKGAEKIINDVKRMLGGGSPDILERLPRTVTGVWKSTGVYPTGMAGDLFKVSQKLDGGMAGVEDTLLWTFKGALIGCAAQMLQGRLKTQVFGDVGPVRVEVNLGILPKEGPNIVLYGHFSPLLKKGIGRAAKGRKIQVMGVCTDPFIPPYAFAPLTNYGSQEIPLMTGGVDLIVAGDQCVNPSLIDLAKIWKVGIISTEVLRKEDPGTFAQEIVKKGQEAFETRGDVPRDIPDMKESGIMGFSAKRIDAKKLLNAINGRKIKGVAILAGCNNVKLTQDREIVSLAKELLRRDVFCISEGCASVSLAKYGLLNPSQREATCGKGLLSLLTSLGKNVPSVIDLGSCENGGVTDFLISMSHAGKKPLREIPVVSCFPEANRTKAVARAAWTVAMGVPTYLWPSLPVSGSPKTVEGLSDFCEKTFGAKLYAVTQRMDYLEKTEFLMKGLERR